MSQKNQLLKLLGVGFGVAVTIGGTVGTGILRRPGTIARELGDPALILTVWLAVGVYALVGALSIMELGTMLPKAGAWYVYARRAFGRYVGFMIGLGAWLGSVSAMAFGASVMGEYTGLLFPSLASQARLIAIGALVLFVIFHWFGVALAGRAQEIMSVLKAVGLLLFVGACLYFAPDDPPVMNEASAAPALAGKALVVALLASLQGVFYTYDGWHTAAYFAEEDVNPSRNLPRSMIMGVGLIIIIYMLVNIALLAVLPINVMAQSKLPAADAVGVLFGPVAERAVTALLLISIIGIINAQLMFNPRVIYAMARDGLFFKAVATVNRGGTPAVAVVFTAATSVLMILTNTFEKLSDIATFFFVLGYASAFAALIRLRHTEPDLPRPVRAWGYPFSTYALLIVSLAFLAGVVITDPVSSAYAVGFAVLSYPLYRLIARP